MSQVVVEHHGRAKIRYSGIPLPNLQGILKEAQQDALKETAFAWREMFGPSHFSIEAYGLYGQREDRVYTARRKGRGTTTARAPLVKSGDLRQAFLGGAMYVRATGSGQSLKAEARWSSLPYYTFIDLYGKSRAPGPKMYLELTIMTEEQEQQLAEVFSKELQRILDGLTQNEQGPVEADMAA